jgi:hypothetical protein
MMDSYLFTNSRALHLWVHILLETNHVSKEFMFNGLKHICERGQFITGRKQLSLATGISESHIEFLLNAFEKECLIRQQKTNKNRLITVLKYEEYQGENRQQIDNKKTTNRQPIDTTNNEVDTNKNVKNTSSHTQFSAPTPQQVKDYGASIGKSIDGYGFCNFYQSKGWMVGKNKMKDWKASARGWNNRNSEKTIPEVKRKKITQAEYQRTHDMPSPAIGTIINGVEII